MTIQIKFMANFFFFFFFQFPGYYVFKKQWILQFTQKEAHILKHSQLTYFIEYLKLQDEFTRLIKYWRETYKTI